MLVRRWSGVRLGAVVLAVVVLGACGDSSGGSTTEGSKLQVEAAFYPLQWMAERVGGTLVEVNSVTPPGAEPHDLELSPRDVAAISDADVVVYLDGFQPAVDDAVRDVPDGRRFDAATATTLDLTLTPIDDDGEEANSVDPHFWLDPTRLADVADQFAQYLGELDPEHAGTYSSNAAALREDLSALDEELMSGLAACENENLVTSHNAFGYLARRYGLTQVGITGLTPEEEPSPADLAAVTDLVRDNDVRTIYFETLVPSDIAKTVARETGARTEVLDPIEGLTDESQGRNYVEVMRANLRNIMKGQPCL